MSPSDPKSPEWRGVEAQIETYRQAILAADWDAWGNTLTEDVFLSPPNATPVAGREAAVAWVKAFPTITLHDQHR